MNMTWNGTQWDRMKSVATAQDSTGIGIQAVGMQAQLDDAATTTVTENQFANLRLSTRRALLIEGVASGTVVPVSLTSTTVTGTVTVDTELAAAVALSSDAVASPTVPQTAGFLYGYNGTTWDRVRTANTGRLQVDVITGGGGTPANILVDNNAFTDGTSSVGVVGYIFDETAGTALTENDTAAARIDNKRAQVFTLEDATTRGQRTAVDASGRLSVNLTASSATVTVDTELPAAAALADGEASATTMPSAGSRNMIFNGTTWDRARGAVTLADALANPGTGLAQGQAFLMGYNGTTWDRVRTANTGRLQVDVVTGGGSSAPTTPINSYDTTASIAAGATDNHDTADLGGNTRDLRKIIMGASVPLKGEVQSVINGSGTTIGVFWSAAGQSNVWEPPHPDYGSVVFSANAGFDGFRLIRTNMDASEAADVYSNIFYES
jgi:hypothetical protein